MSQTNDPGRPEAPYGQGGGSGQPYGAPADPYGQQRRPVRPVDVPDLDLRPENLQDARGELFGDQDDGQGRGHGSTA